MLVGNAFWQLKGEAKVIMSRGAPVEHSTGRGRRVKGGIAFNRVKNAGVFRKAFRSLRAAAIKLTLPCRVRPQG
ncbi:hypothetical protein DN33_3292 [Vibrio cholerae]|nr:hypothetical protein DN33_3292 [Vibrio cholerae]